MKSQDSLFVGDVHVWRLCLGVDSRELDSFGRSLSISEHKRAKTMTTEVRQSFIASRGIVRSILSRYLDVGPSAIEFELNVDGKPSMANANSGLYFNLSHTGATALLAVTSTDDVGIDIEAVNRFENEPDYVRRFFSATENRVIDALPHSQRRHALGLCWTHKEALFKAIGCGLSTRMSRVTSWHGPRTHQHVVTNTCDDIEPYTVSQLSAPDGHVAALAMRGAYAPVIRYMTWCGDR